MVKICIEKTVKINNLCTILLFYLQVRLPLSPSTYHTNPLPLPTSIDFPSISSAAQFPNYPLPNPPSPPPSSPSPSPYSGDRRRGDGVGDAVPGGGVLLRRGCPFRPRGHPRLPLRRRGPYRRQASPPPLLRHLLGRRPLGHLHRRHHHVQVSSRP